jgi:hypothetical protein
MEDDNNIRQGDLVIVSDRTLDNYGLMYFTGVPVEVRFINSPTCYNVDLPYVHNDAGGLFVSIEELTYANPMTPYQKKLRENRMKREKVITLSEITHKVKLISI